MMTPTPKKPSAQVKTITEKLVAYGRERGLAYDRVLTLFLLERTAYRLTLDPILARTITFKGGYVAVRVYSSTRHTTDLDAIITGIDKDVAVEKIKQALTAEVNDGVWFTFEKTNSILTQGEYGGAQLVYRAGLGEPPPKLHRAQIIYIDLGIGDAVTPGPLKLETSFLIGEGHLTWHVYPLETALAEKIHSLLSRATGNSRSKDVYDIFLFLPRASPEILSRAFEATFAYRKSPLPNPLAPALAAIDQTVLRIGWVNAVASIQGAPSFDEAFAAIVNQLSIWKI